MGFKRVNLTLWMRSNICAICGGVGRLSARPISFILQPAPCFVRASACIACDEELNQQGSASAVKIRHLSVKLCVCWPLAFLRDLGTLG